MMSSSWGEYVKISIFGESHGKSVGIVMDGLPAGILLDEEEIARFMSRRAPGQNEYVTLRNEPDTAEIISGTLNGKTTGAPLCAVIKNTDARPDDYRRTEHLARPGHCDYTAHIRYGGYNDTYGGGHLSGRLTAPLCFAGAVSKSALKSHGIIIASHIAAIHGIHDKTPDTSKISRDDLEAILAKTFPVFNDNAGKSMLKEIESARDSGNSAGGVIGCFALNVPAGIGSPLFGGLDSKIASIIFGIPAVKGLEFGCGFGLSSMLGSESNDAFTSINGKVVTDTNKQGGILGGISTGMPITLRVAFKPTPTILIKQKTIDYHTNQNAVIVSSGRHDPCIVLRAPPCVESAVAIAILDELIKAYGYKSDYN